MYCKWRKCSVNSRNIWVLIVAKCIVNKTSFFTLLQLIKVLIVAKCIVNDELIKRLKIAGVVLIVAKCIVNFGIEVIKVSIVKY